MAEDVIGAWYASIRAGTPDALAAVASPDVTLHWNGDRQILPWAGTYHGIVPVLEFFRVLGVHIAVQSVTEVNRFVGADHAVVVVRGEWQAKATGRIIKASATNIFRFDAGLIKQYDVYNDTAAFAAALHSWS